MIGEVVERYSCAAVAATLRKAPTATHNDWGAICYAHGSEYSSHFSECGTWPVG